MNKEIWVWGISEEETEKKAKILSLIDQKMAELKYFVKYTKKKYPDLSPLLKIMVVEKALKDAEDAGFDEETLNYIKKDFEKLKKDAWE